MIYLHSEKGIPRGNFSAIATELWIYILFRNDCT